MELWNEANTSATNYFYFKNLSRVELSEHFVKSVKEEEEAGCWALEFQYYFHVDGLAPSC